MRERFFHIRVCGGCGLRYPSPAGHPFGERCPRCLGSTMPAAVKTVSRESMTRKRTGTKRAAALAVLLDNIRSAWNAGSILRSADGFGFDHAYFCGITPTPENEAVRKTSLGAEGFVEWSHHNDAVRLALRLKAEGWRVYALEEDARAKDIRNADFKTRKEKRLLIVGSEASGVDPGLLALCDEIFHIPMRGGKRSFNAAIAFGIAAFALTGADEP